MCARGGESRRVVVIWFCVHRPVSGFSISLTAGLSRHEHQIVRNRRLLFLVAVLTIVAAGCDWLDVAPPGTAPVRYRDAIFNTVTVTTNVTYGSAVNLENQTITLHLDMYQPAGDTVTSRPAIVWVHGGSFCCGNRTSSEIVDEATTFAKQ